MEEELLEKLLTKFIGLTEFGALRWHFAGDVSKAYVTVYKDSRLKLTDNVLDITALEGETVRLDSRLHQEPIPALLGSLHKAAQESSGRFRTGAVKAISTGSLNSACEKLLSGEEEVYLCSCLVCGAQFDPRRSYNHITQKEEKTGKGAYVCQECISKIGLAEAQAKLEKAVRAMRNSINDDPITGDTNPGLEAATFPKAETKSSEVSSSSSLELKEKKQDEPQNI
jgi:predicted RNA-binding protein YlxR (DUF448 family)